MTGLDNGVVNVFSSALNKTNNFTAHSQSIYKIIYTNGYILTASGDYTVKIWDPSNWSLYGTYTGHVGIVYSLVALSNTVVLSACSCGELRQWTLASGSFSTTSVVYSTSGTCCGGFTFTGSMVLDACYIPSLNQVAAALWNGYIQLYTKDSSAITGKLSSYTSNGVTYGHTSGVFTLALVDNTNGYLASGATDTKVIIWDVPNSSVKYTLTGHTDSVICLRLWPATNYLASGSLDTTVRLWDTTTGSFIRSYNATGQVRSGFEFLGSSTLVIGAMDNAINTYGVTSGTSVVTSTADNGVRSLALITSEILDLF